MRLFLRKGCPDLANSSKVTMSRALQRRENIAGYLFMITSLIFFLGFVIIPMFI